MASKARANQMAAQEKIKAERKNLSIERKRWLKIDGKNDKAVEVGRVAIVIWGSNDYRKLVTIVDLIDRNRVVVDGAGLSNVIRQSYPLRRLQMTKFRVNIVKDIKRSLLEERIKGVGLAGLWAASAAGRRNACQTRREKMTDFSRFKLAYFKRQFKSAVSRELLALRSEAKIAQAKAEGKLSDADIEARYSVAAMQQKARDKRNTNPVLRRVTGSFKRRLSFSSNKKALSRYNRERKHAKYVGQYSSKRAGAGATAASASA